MYSRKLLNFCAAFDSFSGFASRLDPLAALLVSNIPRYTCKVDTAYSVTDDTLCKAAPTDVCDHKTKAKL